MPELYFFADLAGIPQYDAATSPNLGQGEDEAYGPVRGLASQEYRVSSMFRLEAATKPMAYAVCSGTVFVQPQRDAVTDAVSTTRVNLVLQPHVSPDHGLTSVRYFIYRGLLLEDFVDDDGRVLKEDNPTNSDYIAEVWADFNAIKHRYDGLKHPSTHRLGFELNNAGNSEELDAVFLENRVDTVTNRSIQLTPVLKAMSLGRFDSSAPVGFEVVLADDLFKPTLATARVHEHRIVVPAPAAGDIPGSQPIGRIREREQILSFIDPAAYFANFRAFGVIEAGQKNEVFAHDDSFYHRVIRKFFTHDVLYLDLRNEFGHSLNYFRDNQGESGVPTADGTHLRISINRSITDPMDEVNYYTDFWPIYRVSAFPTVQQRNNFVQVSFRDAHHPDPLFFLENEFNLDASRFLEHDDAPVSPPGWTHVFVLRSPALVGNGPAPAYHLRVMLISRDRSHPGLPLSVVPRKHPLDNLFGPVQTLTALPAGRRIVWERRLGKHYVDARKDFGVELIVEITRLVSGEVVTLLATLVDFRGSSDSVVNLIEPGDGASANPRVDQAIRSMFSELFDVRISNLSLISRQASVPSIVATPLEDDGLEDQLVLGIHVTRDEYEDHILPAARSLDSEIQDIFLSLRDLQRHEDENDVEYYRAILEVAGLDGAGVYQEVTLTGGNLDVFTVDRALVNTEAVGLEIDQDDRVFTDPNAYFDVEELLDYIEAVEQVYLLRDRDPDSNDEAARSGATRIRVHSYGRQRKSRKALYHFYGRVKEWGAEEALEAAIPDAPYEDDEDEDDVRRLRREELKQVRGGETAFEHLLATADENDVQDNHGPYLQVGRALQPTVIQQVDFGQMLYGFESLVMPSVDAPTLGEGYRHFNIERAYTLAGLVANIATPATETLIHDEDDHSPLDTLFPPLSADIDAYYELSAPDADLLSNADAIGLMHAYEALKENQDLRLSNLLRLYYQDDLGDLTLAAARPIYYTFKEHWRIMALHQQFTIRVDDDHFKWLPDPQHSGVWQVRRAELMTEMENFCNFWYNVYRHATVTAQRIIYNKVFTYFPGGSTSEFNAAQLSEIRGYLDHILDNRFLPFLRSEIELEHPGIQWV